MSECAVGLIGAIGCGPFDQGTCILPQHRVRSLSATIAPLRGAVTQLAVVVNSYRTTLPCFSKVPRLTTSLTPPAHSDRMAGSNRSGTESSVPQRIMPQTE